MNYRIVTFIINLIVTVNVLAISINEKAKTAIDGVPFLSAKSSSQPSIMFDQLNTVKVAKALDWVKDSDDCNFCGGHYFESSNIIDTPEPQPFRDAPMDITATKPAFFTKQGTSVVQGDVFLKQPGREIMADKVTFFREDKTGKLKYGIMDGNVKFREYGKLFVANRGSLDFDNKMYTLDHGVYRLREKTPTGLENIWGRAKHVVRDTAGVIKLKRATYTTCPPDKSIWHLWGSDLTLDRNTGRGEVYNALIFFKQAPVFYTPYFNFPIDDRRKSGFLMPAPTIAKTSGFGINLPYYFNLASNYDALFTPTFFTGRGVLLDGMFNYLTPTSTGNVEVSYIPYDRAFVAFRDSTSSVNKTDYGVYQALKKSSSSRGFLKLRNNSVFDESWQGSLSVNYVTDDYFLEDFNAAAANGDEDQLLNRADISYSSEHWDFLGRLQIFQTLHRITQMGTKDQYMRLPQFNLSGDFSDGFLGLDYRLDGEIVNFMYHDNLEQYRLVPESITSGVRINMMPSVSAPLNWIGINIIPKAQFQMTGYGIHGQEKIGASNSITKFYPLLSVDSNAVLTKEVNFFRNGYIQTLEPRLFYLYVPKISQDNIPVFDTYLPAFDFNQLFRPNRFNGVDAVGDAHQVAMAVTTRLLDDYGQERCNAGLGQIIAIRKHQEMLNTRNSYRTLVGKNDNLDPLKDKILSPLVGQIQFFINDKINTTANMAWDLSNQRLNTASVNLQYINRADRVINLWYYYAIKTDQFVPETEAIAMSRVGVSVGWKIWQHWNIIGNLNYNTSYKRAQNYLYGLEYDDCCWAIRAVSSRNFIGVGAADSRNYDSRYYVQFLLKGLGNFGDNGLGDMLVNQISGYRDKFTKGL